MGNHHFKLFQRIYLILLLLMGGANNSIDACRFTVREIGFSILSQTRYSLVIVDNTFNWTKDMRASLRVFNKGSNVHAVLLDSEKDKDHPIVRSALKKGIKFPNCFLLAPNHRLLSLIKKDKNFSSSSDKSFSEFVLNTLLEKSVDSPIRKILRKNIVKKLATIIYIEGDNAAENDIAYNEIVEACNKIKNVMPLMPKEISLPPEIIRLNAHQRTSEEVLLWSLENLDNRLKTPQAIILYGRGRIIGEKLSYNQINKKTVYKLLSMIGADCECGLNRKWMLGAQIPLKWDVITRQNVTSGLSFDVDNPFILGEMSRIMSQEIEGGEDASISFSPEEIDINATLGGIEENKVSNSNNRLKNDLTNDENQDSLSAIIYTLIFLFLFSAVISLILIYRKREQ